MAMAMGACRIRNTRRGWCRSLLLSIFDGNGTGGLESTGRNVIRRVFLGELVIRDDGSDMRLWTFGTVLCRQVRDGEGWFAWRFRKIYVPYLNWRRSWSSVRPRAIYV